MSAKQLAYSIHDGDEEWDIVFAPREASARVKGANILDMDKEDIEVERLKWADSYAPGPIPKLVQIQNGWRWECTGCDRWIPDDDGEGLAPVEIGRALYCCTACHDWDIADRRERHAAMWWVAAAMAAQLRQALPDAVLTGNAHAYVNKVDGVYVGQQCLIPFTFPGCKIAPAHWRFDKHGEEPGPSVCAGDHEAWKAWRGQS